MGLKDFQLRIVAGLTPVLFCTRCTDHAWCASLYSGDDVSQLVTAAVRHAEQHHSGDTWQPHDMLREAARPL